MAKEVSNKKNSNAKKFKPVDGLSYGQLKFGYWWIEHKVLMKRILEGILIVVGTILLGYGVYGFGYYIFWGIEEDRLLAAQLTSNGTASIHDYIESISAQDIILSDIYKFPGVDNTYDLVIEATNPNKEWFAKFNYTYNINGKDAQTHQAFISPGEKNYLTEFLYDSIVGPVSANIKISDMRWRRLIRKEIEDVDVYIKERTDFKISDIKLVKEKQPGKVPLNKVEFTAKNNTSYNYWEVDFYILLKSGSQLSGINKYQVYQFKSGETKEIELLWPGNISGSISVLPSINIFDKSNYMEFDLGSGYLK